MSVDDYRSFRSKHAGRAKGHDPQVNNVQGLGEVGAERPLVAAAS